LSDVIVECYYDFNFDSDENLNFQLLCEHEIIRGKEIDSQFHFEHYDNEYLEKEKKTKSKF